ncbi:hypothetical protein GCM10010178_92200 [Lentzea flava]|uniref:Uncharacterized protein n=1 Tax=Lentzea flava TaxID=103732 RepID=A0ABQ2VI31_9PSEU|nr:hypothetical protein GCM10010178_92200 [Lentzea flava]
MVGVLSREEIAVLRSYAAGVVRLADYGLKSCTWIAGRSEESGLWVPAEPVHDTRIVAIVKGHLPEGSLDWEVAWHAPDCLTASAAAARRAAATLPESGGVVVLESIEDVAAWCRLIGDVLAALDPYAEGRPREVQDAAQRTSDWLEALRQGIDQITPCRKA